MPLLNPMKIRQPIPGGLRGWWNRPPVLNGLKAWWRSDGPVSFASGLNVNTWFDDSGNGGHLVASAGGNEAVLVPNVLNGLPGMRLTGTVNGRTTQMTCSNPLAGATAAEIIAVAQSLTGVGTDNHSMWAWGAYRGTVASSFVGYFAYVDEKVYDDFGSTTRPASAAITGNAVRSPFIFNSFVSGATKDTYINGTSQHIQNAVANTIGWSTLTWIGNDGALGTQQYEGYLFEVLPFNRVLSSPERAAVYAYLNTRWGLSATAP